VLQDRGRAPRAATRAALRCAVLAVVVALSGLAGLGLAGPAAAADLDCTPMGDPACRDLAPVVECVWVETNGSRTIVWGYDNPSTVVIHIDIGNKNNMSPGAADGGQVTEFLPGRHLNAFVTNVPGTSASWRLGNNTASLSGSTAACVTKPVSLIGSATALAIFLLLLAAAIPFAVRPRHGHTGTRPVWGKA
jgi:hypothetical protein